MTNADDRAQMVETVLWAFFFFFFWLNVDVDG
jgi:hypothetical protein